MKKIIISFVLLMTTVCAHADIFNLGVKGGVNFSTIGIDGFSDNSYRVGFNAGMVTSINLPIVGLGIQAEALYTVKGCDVPLMGEDYAMKLGYVEVPVYLRWKFNLPIVKPYIGVGPYLGYAVYKDFDEAAESFVKSDDIQDFDWGVGITGGVELIDKAQVGVSYQWGVQNIYDGSGDGTLRNQNLAISVGFMFF
ncbi:MAG: PorT family protein [Paludibacteraceae bacterium]|nr:PorT family protein [Paludibacteraceae bacterium]